MTLNIALHNPTKVDLHCFDHGGDTCGCLTFSDKDGNRIEVYTTPEVATAIAEAFDDAMHPEPAEPNAEMVADRKAYLDAQLRAAGRGHLVGGL